MELKWKLPLNLFLTAILLVGISPGIDADTPINIEKDISTAELWGVPSQLTFYLYDEIDAVVPIASQAFDAAIWFAAEDYPAGKTIHVSAQLTDTDMLVTDSQLWLDTVIDGIQVGSRDAIRLDVSLLRDISVDKYIESRGAGFIFPDGSIQDTAGVLVETDPGLPAHTADVGAHHPPYTDAAAVAAIKAEDGSGSGLDADLLDGHDSSVFSTVTHNHDPAYVNTTGPDAVTGSSSAAMLQATNEGTGAGLRGSSQGHHGTIGYTDASDKAGVFGNSTSGYGVWGNSVDNHAVFGQSTGGRGVKGVSPAGGVYGESTSGLGVEGRSNTNDGIVGVTYASDKSGVFGNSDVGVGVTGRSGGGSGVLGVTTSSDPGDAGVTARNEGSGLALRAEGDVFVTAGAYRGDIGPGGGAPFPRPAWDSGWRAIASGQNLVIPHTVGGNVDDYFVDFQQKMVDTGIGIHNKYNGGEHYYSTALGHIYRGAYWHDLKSYEISVERYADDAETQQIRVRIWVVR